MSKHPTEYAIVDIETTGGTAANGGITEIAILIHDGEQVTEQFESLINPGMDIPYWIYGLTGINNETVENAPSFSEIAEKVFELLKDRVFVAHNVNFDYTFIKQHLKNEGFNFSAQKLCTVRMSRKIKPGFHSYSLGTLCENLGIPINNRHRAMGDAEATAVLFSKLIKWDSEGIIPQMLKRNSKEQQLPPNLPKKEFEALTDSPGVYYFHDSAGKVIYVGKAVNLKKRISSHFTGHNPNKQRQGFLKDIFHISFEECGTELAALLLEYSEIKNFWPKYNRALKKYEPPFGIYTYTDINGYIRPVAGKLAKNQSAIKNYSREYDAVNELLDLINDFELDIRLCYLGQSSDFFDLNFNPDLRDTPLPDPEIHNKRLKLALDSLTKNLPNYVIIDKGRTPDEKSCIWVENGEFYGMGYFSKEFDIHSLSEIKPLLKRYPSNYYTMNLITEYAEKYPGKVFRVKIENKKS